MKLAANGTGGDFNTVWTITHYQQYDSVHLRWGPIICISNKFLGAAAELYGPHFEIHTLPSVILMA